MEYTVNSGIPAKQRVGCLVVGVFEHRRLSEQAQQLDNVSGGYLGGICRRGDMDGKLGQIMVLHSVPNTLCERVMLVGCGKERELDERHYRRITRAAAEALGALGGTDAVSYLPDLHVKGRSLDWKVQQALLVTDAVLYRFAIYKKEPEKRSLRRVSFGLENRRELRDGEHALEVALAIARGVERTKNVANEPPNVCTPAFLAERAQEWFGDKAHCKVHVVEREEMAELGMGAFLAVAKGSRLPPKLIAIEYDGTDEQQKPYVFVGKGLTFDSGGISIKPAERMDEMKYDMCGAAAVLGIMSAVQSLALPLRVVGLIGAAENMPGGDAYKPGDIVRSMSGQTIEVLNTDAEGRLVLADCLTYAERYQPQTLIDMATLTGACVVALGRYASGLLTKDEGLSRELVEASQEAADPLWPLPLWEDYQEAINSPFADMANVGNREGGTITAACFLSRYTKGQRWAHLDIAGTAWLSGKEKGATGRPVAAIIQYLLGRIPDTAKAAK